MALEVEIWITDRDGQTHQITAPTDMNMNLMEVIRAYELAPEGTIGICGGMAMCASCQCYVESDHALPEQVDDERAMLAEAFYLQDNSRLGCQLFITPEMRGLLVRIAPES
jgi:ferredoxin